MLRPSVASAADAGAPKNPRHLIICVDGVGFSTIEKLQKENRLRSFNTPAHLLAPFPTLTNIAMTEILRPAGAPNAAGYEDSYYDTEHQRLRGNLLDRFNNRRFIKASFRELFDYHPSAIKSGLGYVAPPLSTYLEALTDLIRLRQKFVASESKVFFAYTGASDSLAHLGGERLLRRFLRRLDDTITQIKRDSETPVEVTIFSDHGNHFTKYRRVNLKEPLRRAGWRLDDNVRNNRSVVFPQFGLVGSAVLFSTENAKASLANTVAEARGVDFAAYEKNGVAHVVSRGGKATIERRGNSFRYKAEGGDPLELTKVSQNLIEQGKADADGFINAEDWFNATVDANRPDAARRVHEGVVARGVQHRASVIVNFEDGYYTGSHLLDLFSILQATHGNLGKHQSYGFVMSTARHLPVYLKAEAMWEVIGSPRLEKTVAIERVRSSVSDSKLGSLQR